MHTTFRRPASQFLDGPFPADPPPGAPMGAAAMTTRRRELSNTMRNPADSGIGPGGVEGYGKFWG